MNELRPICVLMLLVELMELIQGCPANCRDCDPTTSLCFACAEGFQLSVKGTCVNAITVPNCILYGPTNQCFRCEPTYTLSNGQCLKDYSACIENDRLDLTVCLTCAFGTVLSGNKCVGAINCVIAADPCPACMSGFTLEKGQCLDNTGNCQKTGAKGVCVICKEGFKLMGYTCMPKKLAVQGCTIHDAAGKCLLCKSGYSLYENNCLLPSQTQSIQQVVRQLSTIPSQSTASFPTPVSADTGFGGFGEGAFGGFGDSGFGSDLNFGGFTAINEQSSSSISAPLISNCQNADPSNLAVCLTCFSGYTLSLGGCLMFRSTPTNFCQAYILLSGVCVACFPGYTLANSLCSPSPPPDLDPNCFKYNGPICATCSNRYYVNSQGICTPVNPLCKDYSFNGSCLSCYPGYTLSGINCIISKPQDPNCKSFIIDGNCLVCIAGYYLNQSTNSCQPTNPLCKTSNPNDGFCTSCYPGYSLMQGLCKVTDPNCQNFDINKNTCKQCSSRFYLSVTGRCIEMNPLCKTGDSNTGACLTCYPGYVLLGTLCVVKTITSSSPNCLTTDNFGTCSSCNAGYYLTANKNCQQLNPLCKTYTTDSTACATCYLGYTLQIGQCVVTNNQPLSSDPYCIRFNGKLSAACASGYYLAQTGNCSALNPLCKTSNSTTGACTSCYPGYNLSGITCNVAPVNIPNCANVVGNTCVACQTGYYLSNGFCQVVDKLCATYDLSSGVCLSCVAGYTFQMGQCIYSQSVDYNCAYFSNKQCLECKAGYVMINYWCTPLDPNCLQFDATINSCKQCSRGLTPSGPGCF